MFKSAKKVRSVKKATNSNKYNQHYLKGQNLIKMAQPVMKGLKKNSKQVFKSIKPDKKGKKIPYQTLQLFLGPDIWQPLLRRLGAETLHRKRKLRKSERSKFEEKSSKIGLKPFSKWLLLKERGGRKNKVEIIFKALFMF